MKQRLLTLLCLLCCLSASTAWADTTVENTIAKIADNNGWVNGTAYKSWSLDNVVTISCTGGGNSGKYYTSGEEWRLYQTEKATISIETKEGYYLNSVKITYNISNTGALFDSDDIVESKKIVTISGTTTTSVTYQVGNSGTATNGQVKVTAISVTYSSTGGETTVATPTFSLATGDYYGTQSVTIACGTEGASIRYTLDGNTPTEDSAEYSSLLPISISSTTTLKAIAIKEGLKTSDVATATYTILPVCTTIDDFKSIGDGEKGKLQLKDAVVIGVATGSRTDVYIQDTTGGLELFKYTGPTVEVGKYISGTIIGTYTLYNDVTPEINSGATYNLTVSDGDAAEPVIVNIDVLVSNKEEYVNRLIKIVDAKYNSTTETISQSDVEGTISPYKAFSYMPTEWPESFDITGVFILAKKDGNILIEIAPRSEADIVQKGGKITPTLSFDPEEVTAYLDALREFNAPVLTTDPAGLTVTYSMTGDAVGTINETTGEITFNTAGTIGSATVTASFAGNDKYKPATATYTLKVVAMKPDYIFYESFDKCDGTGGNDGKWSGSIASGTLYTDNDGWDCGNGKGANDCAKFGTGSAKGSATTPELRFVSGVDYLLTFMAAAWDGKNENTTLKLSLSEGCGGTLSESSVTLKKGEWTEYKVYITGVTSSPQITFEAENSSNNRFFLDEVYVRECNVKIGEAGVATFCSKYALDFTKSNVKAYIATGTNDDETAVMLTNVPDAPAREGLILKAAKGSYYVPRTSEVKTDVTGNRMVAVMEEAGFDVPSTYAGCTNYILARASSGDKQVAFYPIATGYTYTLSTGKAYLALPIQTNAAPVRIIFDDEDDPSGIEDVRYEETGINDATYNLQGINVDDNFKGIVIKNGKKFYNR